MKIFVKYVVLALVLCLSILESHEEPTTVCRTFDPEKESLPSSKCTETVYVHSNIQQVRQNSLDECKKEQIQQITTQVAEDKLVDLEKKLESKCTDDISSLQKQLKNQSDMIVTLEKRVASRTTACRNESARLDGGWIGLCNGYVYKLSSASQNYDASRKFCQDIGGDLAVYGVRSLDNRRIIQKALNTQTWTWIGMNDLDVEGTWKWINGDPVTSAQDFWGKSQPNGGGRQNCAVMYNANQSSHDDECSYSRLALCEKQWS